MHMTMCSLRTRRNTLARISSLPSEVMACIFPLCDGLYDSCIHSYGPSRSLKLGWIRVTHVCRRWRHIALEHPRLWNMPPTDLGFNWLKLTLSRAKAVPLFLNLKGYFRDDVLHIITKHISQTRVLAFQPFGWESGATLQALSYSNSLESLTLEILYPNNHSFMLDILGDKFPHLCRLNLKEVGFHWSSPIFCSLTHLNVIFRSPDQKDMWNNHPKSSCDTPSIYDSFFCALGNMPGLEVLVLKNSLPPRPQNYPIDHIAALPRLTKLCLDDKMAACFDIVKRLRFPPSCCLILKPEHGHDDPRRFVEILPVLKDHSGNVDRPPLIFSVQADMACYEVSMHRNRDLLDTTAPDFQISAVPDLFLCIPHTGWRTVDRAPLQAVCERIALDDIRVLIIHHANTSPERAPTVQEWIDIFGRCRAVEHVRITGGATSFFLALLPTSQQDSQRGPTSQQLFLENLQSITLLSVYFDSLSAEFEGMTVGDLILRCLAIRKKVKALPIIRIGANCNYDGTDKYVEELKAMADVEWLPMDEDEWEWLDDRNPSPCDSD